MTWTTNLGLCIAGRPQRRAVLPSQLATADAIRTFGVPISSLGPRAGRSEAVGSPPAEPAGGNTPRHFAIWTRSDPRRNVENSVSCIRGVAMITLVLARLIVASIVLPGVPGKKTRLAVCADGCGWGKFMARIPAAAACPECNKAKVKFAASNEEIAIRCLQPSEPPCQEFVPSLKYNRGQHTWRDFRCTGHQGKL